MIFLALASEAYREIENQALFLATSPIIFDDSLVPLGTLNHSLSTGSGESQGYGIRN